jgi:hypothetical protein
MRDQIEGGDGRHQIEGEPARHARSRPAAPDRGRWPELLARIVAAPCSPAPSTAARIRICARLHPSTHAS